MAFQIGARDSVYTSVMTLYIRYRTSTSTMTCHTVLSLLLKFKLSTSKLSITLVSAAIRLRQYCVDLDDKLICPDNDSTTMSYL